MVERDKTSLGELWTLDGLRAILLSVLRVLRALPYRLHARWTGSPAPRLRRHRSKVPNAEVMNDDPWAVRMVDWIGVMLCWCVIGVPVGLPMLITGAFTSERHVVIRVLAPLAVGAGIVTAFVLVVTSEGGGGGGGDYFDVCWDSPGGAYRC